MTQDTPNTLRILLVDDSEDNRKLSLRRLQKLGYSADMATDGLHALEMLAKSEYDLVLLDCEMPRMDGYAAATEIRRREGALKHTVVVAMTAHAADSARAKCIEAGMDDCVSKLMSLDALKSILERCRPKDSAA